MRRSGYERGARWLLLCLLLLGVVSMHHFMPPACPDQPAAMAGVAVASVQEDHPAQPHCPASEHELAHLCLAVLTAVASLLLIVFLLLMSLPVRILTLRRPPLIRRADRPPDPSGRDLLSSVCVLRL
ncbi:hypothetical protein [Actinocrispum sp. NPDC049592]|uniref:hypothetical protein n=1 Tax=Actinocrispum sp. NPDC049592 TaxID=3154835 RepID=UPI00341D0D45